MGSLWGHSGVTLGSLWGYFGVTLGSPWGHFGISLQKRTPQAGRQTNEIHPPGQAAGGGENRPPRARRQTNRTHPPRQGMGGVIVSEVGVIMVSGAQSSDRELPVPTERVHFKPRCLTQAECDQLKQNASGSSQMRPVQAENAGEERNQ